MRVILISPRALSFVETLGPPMEQRGRADQVGTGLQRHTASGLGLLEVVDGGEMAIHQDRIGQLPQMFHGLQFRGGGWEKQQMDVVGHAQALGTVPSGSIQDEHNLLAW
jgi:hypothetical protein